MEISIFFAWYDLWVGAYWNRLVSTLYICPIPCVCIRVVFDKRFFTRKSQKNNES